MSEAGGLSRAKGVLVLNTPFCELHKALVLCKLALVVRGIALFCSISPSL